MIKLNDEEKEFIELCRVKFNSIQNRVRNRRSYKDKNILNEFTFSQFVEFARENGLEVGLHCHRPNRDANYSSSNLVFITADEHHAITAKERQKLSDEQIAELTCLRDSLSLRALAKRFKVSHVTVDRYVKRNRKKAK
jgi:DNA-binding CsgD family transcriptional regulator